MTQLIIMCDKGKFWALKIEKYSQKLLIKYYD